MKKLLMATTALILTGVIASPARAEVSTEEFVQKASVAGKFEIESSKVALQRSEDADVKAFAQKMINDHEKADKKLKATLKEANVSADKVPQDLDSEHQKILDDLKSAKAEKFNEEYIEAQEDAHKDAVKLFKDYSEKGDNAALKQFAANTLPTLETHHENVEKLDKKDDDTLEKEAK